MLNSYDESSIQILSDIEHIRKNVSMYIGDNIEDPRQLLQEAIDNAIDEAVNGYSNGFTIYITVDKNESKYIVKDFGRGIPAGYKEINGKNISILEALTTKSNSGGKFDNKAYLSSAGLHGLGMKCINALSDSMYIRTVNNGILGEIYLCNGEITSDIDNNNVYSKTNKNSFTEIGFTISKENPYFDSYIISLDYIISRLNIYSAFGIENIKLIINNIEKTNEYVVAHAPADLYKERFSSSSALSADLCVENSNKEKFRLVFNYTSNSTTSYYFYGYTNFLYNKNGGGHIIAAQSAIVNAVNKFCKDRNIPIPSTTSSDYFIGLSAIVHCNIMHKAFSNQTKDRLVTGTNTTRDYFNELVDSLSDSILLNVFNKNVGLTKALIQRISDYRKERENRKELKGLSQYITINKSEGSLVRRSSVYEKLTECSSKNRDECECIMTEGDSASGGLIRMRDKKTTAILPLRGKIKNVVGCSITECLKNKEIAGIISSMGTGILDKCDIEKFRYNEVLYAGDADADGYHITNLVIALFVNLMPDIVKSGKLKIILSPLYGYKDKKNNWQPAFRFDDLPDYIKDNGRFERFKGLGALGDIQVKEFLLDKSKRKLLTVDYPSDIEKFNYIMSTSEGKRELLTNLKILQ